MAPYENTRLRARMAELAAKNKDQTGAIPDSPSPFFRLPAEFRNLIYSYALRCPTKLFYYPVGKFSAKRMHPRICTTVNPARRPEQLARDFPWFNQLQFVNRQLRSEPQWQELRYSVLDITNTWARGFQTFPWSLGQVAVRCMDTLLIRGFTAILTLPPPPPGPGGPWRPFGVTVDHFWRSIRDLVHISQVLGGFCGNNPRIKINYVVPYFDMLPPSPLDLYLRRQHIREVGAREEILDVWQMMRFGVFFESVIRAKNGAISLLPLNRGRHDLMSVIAKYREGSEELRTKEKEGIRQLSALRIFPALERWKPGERARVEEALREDGLGDKSIELWFERVEGWMRDGI